MSFFEGFEVFNFDQGVPYVSVTKNGMTFNKAVIMKMGYPENVVLLLNAATKCIAVKKCTSDTPNCISFYKPNERNVLSVRWNAKDLLNTIKEMMSWNLSSESYKAEGHYIKEEEAIVFDLLKAKMLI